MTLGLVNWFGWFAVTMVLVGVGGLAGLTGGRCDVWLIDGGLCDFLPALGCEGWGDFGCIGWFCGFWFVGVACDGERFTVGV